ncbi:transglycosylase domain-containing protein [Streptomyces sp. MJP52]|uniref:transglycosylase domain-containing protein n=1 Tax=Streptomyces sp. MJP52 TaxID=2940555 RepID=UPI0024771198|nr:transglycosylase domain-containing protein [Streptomyces sp. MJP52]MDH6226767.1 membrane peptidoglycan carboxypeptidase [Streptomyces sp. MJP52]
MTNDRRKEPFQGREPQRPPDAPAAARGAAGGAAPAARRKGWRRALPTWRFTLLGLVAVILLGAAALAAGYHLVKIPRANALATMQSNVFLYADGSRLARDGDVNRESVQLSQVSRHARHAVLAAEDRDFYDGSGVDPQAMVRGAWNTVTGKGRQSGSTITQQYVKNYYLGQEQTLTRKAKEFFIAIKLDREKSKDEILQGYLNTSYFGRNTYGIQAAAHAYYGVDASELDAAQGAYLAALLNSPNAYDVDAHPENREKALVRWNYVLDGMVKEGWLGRAERAALEFPAPRPNRANTALSGQRGYIVNAVKAYLAEHGILEEAELDGGGYRIWTTLRRPAQDALVGAVEEEVLDNLEPQVRDADRNVRAGAAAIDPRTGKVVAMYGGTDYVKQYTNNATRRDFQVGSTFKPFVLAAALEHGAHTHDGRPITPQTMYDGTSKRAVEGWPGDRYTPENEDDRSYGEISVSEATDKSVNAVYAQMAVDVGPDRVHRTAVRLGLPERTPDMVASPSIALGTATASVLDMTQAYATLADHGRHRPYTLVEKITRNGSRTVPLPERRTTQAVDRVAADTTTSVLRGVVAGGTATAAQAAGRPAAGKTGTAEEDTAAWFAGYTPDLVAVVSVMGQDPETAAHKPLYGAMGLGRINGGGVPAQIWAKFVKDATEGEEASAFDLRIRSGSGDLELPYAVPGDGASASASPSEGSGDDGFPWDSGPAEGDGSFEDRGEESDGDDGDGTGDGSGEGDAAGPAPGPGGSAVPSPGSDADDAPGDAAPPSGPAHPAPPPAHHPPHHPPHHQDPPGGGPHLPPHEQHPWPWPHLAL